ncbi:hypothetical protein FKM82_026811 [Ascaphus truei]
MSKLIHLFYRPLREITFNHFSQIFYEIVINLQKMNSIVGKTGSMHRSCERWQIIRYVLYPLAVFVFYF